MPTTPTTPTAGVGPSLTVDAMQAGGAPASGDKKVSVDSGGERQAVSAAAAAEKPSSGEDRKSLPEAFRDANAKVEAVRTSTLGSSDPKYHGLVRDSLRALVRVGRMVEAAALFSDNEEARDVSTASLKYLLVDYLVGDMYMCLHDQRVRAAAIRTAKAVLRKFLDRMRALGMMSKDDEALYKRGGRAASIVTSRDERFARLRRKRTLEAELKQIRAREEAAARRTKAGRVGGGGGGAGGDDEEEEDELERRKRMAMIELAVSESLAHLRFADDELKMLDFKAKRDAAAAEGGTGHAAPRDAKPRGRGAGGKKSSIIRINSAQEFMRTVGITGRPRQFRPGKTELNLAPASLASRVATSGAGARADQRAAVLNSMFVPRNMPTMDMDTLLKMEAKAGKIPAEALNAAQRPPPQAAPARRADGTSGPHRRVRRVSGRPEESDPDSEDVDEETHERKQRKKREWDAYKDDHEKGAGNRLGNPRGRNFI